MNNYSAEQLKQIIHLLYLGLTNLDLSEGTERESVEMALESLANYQFSNAISHLKMGHAATNKEVSVSSKFAGAIESFLKSNSKTQPAKKTKTKIKPAKINTKTKARLSLARKPKRRT